ncbi:helix-turn-helix domain-containing protein [Paenalkalicoccus suaedae]|uniref:Helix-turn-helix domain-containing protein n=1 Tax=Paenalkalicoccus suaedae TaxID=2592382 RepID=A0A859FG90_9BACI|nr:helix-turn-helix transcriptional regulator [Paenalkalicoccus suaedae]QKS71692.1 helix-turn-helix domain-containing protein [Paenalkalicoccus suaedae]QKS71746.1 helix-turn-helix domain-containing protein [Paenalkalicoccus suaedae]
MELDFGKVMRQARERAGFSQERMAHDMYTSISAVSKMETGKQRIELSMFTNWMRHTNAQDLMIAAMVGMDVTTIQPVLEALTRIVGGFICVL